MNSAIASLIILSGCAAAPPPVPQQPPAAAAKIVTKQYEDAAKKEIPAITAPAVTPKRVQTVHDADMNARKALEKLEAQGDSPTPEALDAARAAVGKLSDTLKSPPK